MKNQNNTSSPHDSLEMDDRQQFMSYERFVESGFAYSNVLDIRLNDECKRIFIDPSSIVSLKHYYRLVKKINLSGDKHLGMNTFLPEIYQLLKKYGFQRYAK